MEVDGSLAALTYGRMIEPLSVYMIFDVSFHDWGFSRRVARFVSHTSGRMIVDAMITNLSV